MTAHRQFDGIRNHLAADEGAFHPLMAHGDAIGYGDRIETARHPAADLHAGPRHISLVIERRVARSGVVTRTRNRNEGTRDFFLGQSHRIIIAAVRCALRSDRHVTAREFRLVELVCHCALSFGPGLCRNAGTICKHAIARSGWTTIISLIETARNFPTRP